MALFLTLKQDVIAGTFKTKVSQPWLIARAEKIQASVFLPNEHSVDDWYAAVLCSAHSVARGLHVGDLHPRFLF